MIHDDDDKCHETNARGRFITYLTPTANNVSVYCFCYYSGHPIGFATVYYVSRRTRFENGSISHEMYLETTIGRIYRKRAPPRYRRRKTPRTITNTFGGPVTFRARRLSFPIRVERAPSRNRRRIYA